MRPYASIAVVLVLLMLIGCRQKAAVPEGGSQPVSVVCTACQMTGTLSLPKYAADETWPKPCSRCQKQAVYAYINCSRCGRPVPLKDPRTGGFGYPRLCPNCNRKWEP